jgi:hypothetical protein
MLLTDSRSWFAKNGADRVQTRTLLKYFNSLEESPWAEFQIRPSPDSSGLGKVAESVRYQTS